MYIFLIFRWVLTYSHANGTCSVMTSMCLPIILRYLTINLTILHQILRVSSILAIGLRISLARFILTNISIRMVIFLNLLSNSSSSHEAFVIRILLVLMCLQIVAFILVSLIKMNHVLHLPILLSPILKSGRWSRPNRLTYYILYFSMLNILIVSSLLSSPLLHWKLLTILVWSYIRSIQRCSSVSAKHSFVQLDLLAVVLN